MTVGSLFAEIVHVMYCMMKTLLLYYGCHIIILTIFYQFLYDAEVRHKLFVRANLNMDNYAILLILLILIKQRNTSMADCLTIKYGLPVFIFNYWQSRIEIIKMCLDFLAYKCT